MLNIEFGQGINSAKEKFRAISRPRVLRKALLLGAAVSLIAACAPRSASSSMTDDPSYPLEWGNGKLSDLRLSTDGPLETLWFGIDFNHNDPEYPGESLKVIVCFRGNGEFRVQSSQLLPPEDEGDILNLPYLFDGDCQIKWPITGMQLDETDRIRVGIKSLDEPCEASYLMRTYIVIRVSDRRLEGHYLGEEIIDPSSLIPREEELGKYFMPTCLS